MIWKSKRNQHIAQSADFLTAVISFVVTFYLWGCFYENGFLGFQPPLAAPNNWIGILILVGITFVFIFESNNAYNFQRFTSLVREYTIVFKVVVIGFLFSLFIQYMLGDRFIFPRRVLILNFFVLASLFFLEKTFMFYVALLVRRNYDKKRVIIIGTGKEAKRLIASIVRHKYFGLSIIGLVSENPEYSVQKVLNHPVLGTIDNLEQILRRYNPEEIIIALQGQNLGPVQRIFTLSTEAGIQVRLISDFFSAMTKNLQVDNLFGINFISFYPFHRTFLDGFYKRGMDITFSSIMIILLLPVYIVIALMIYIKDGFPVLFKWKVMGYNRKPIVSWKFRTMVKNADEIKKELLEKNEMKGPMFKMEKDPRILPFGHFLRKYSLDELPQLFSVLKGDLSLVGPRPPLQYEFKEFELWQMRKLSVKPGLTCLWQINGRNKINDFNDWVKLDLDYIDNWSIMLDLKILLKTFNAITKGSGK